MKAPTLELYKFVILPIVFIDRFKSRVVNGN